MHTQTLIIPHELPALNRVIDESKKHWSAYHKLKLQYTGLVACLARRQLRPVLSGRVYLSFVWYCPDRRKDPDNISSAGRKMILDGLTQAGIIKDDSWRLIEGFSDTLTHHNAP